jgi:haloacetate dehalogenase
MWDGMNAGRAMQVYHWTFLAQPEPVPENLIKGDPLGWLDHTIASWTRAKSLALFDPLAMQAYGESFGDPARIHAACEDYRAGATTDVEHDRVDLAAGTRILCPTLILWGERDRLIPPSTARAFEQAIAGSRAVVLPGLGHVPQEEDPVASLAAAREFLGLK